MPVQTELLKQLVRQLAWPCPFRGVQSCNAATGQAGAGQADLAKLAKLTWRSPWPVSSCATPRLLSLTVALNRGGEHQTALPVPPCEALNIQRSMVAAYRTVTRSWGFAFGEWASSTQIRWGAPLNPLRGFTLGQVWTAAGPRPRGPPLFIAWSNDSSGNHPCLAAVLVIQLSKARLLPPLPPSTSSPSTTNRPPPTSSIPKTCQGHSFHACNANAGAQPGPDQAVKDSQAIARTERSARHALACRD
eukprot:364784-Chlamydomonas_euryale.AAC.14